VIANAGEADDLAARTAPVLRRLGYDNLVISTANTRRSSTMVWYRRGMEQEAQKMAAELGIGQVRMRPPGRITAGGEQGDVWLFVGHRRPPLIEAAMG
jgi:LytR cell envelope-related transcriptional attenuator